MNRDDKWKKCWSIGGGGGITYYVASMHVMNNNYPKKKISVDWKKSQKWE